MKKLTLNTSPETTTFDTEEIYLRLKEVRQRAGEKHGSGRKCIYYCFNDADGMTAPASDVKLNDAEKISVNLKERERIRISMYSLFSIMVKKMTIPPDQRDSFFVDDIDVVLATDIPELFADMVETTGVEGYFDLVEIPPSDKSIPNWQYIGRWLNLNVLEKYDRVLYVDSDTIWHDDPQLLFDKYNVAEVYGREEIGFPMDTNTGAYGKDGRYLLDMVDAGIVSEWSSSQHGTIPPKYCMGVMLFNNGFHNYVYSKVKYLKSCIQKCIDGKQFYPLPNLRIVDEYAMWCLLGQIHNASYDYFSPQDVSMPYGEKKHADYYNPVLLHYTTNKEKEAVENIPELEELKKYMNNYEES